MEYEKVQENISKINYYKKILKIRETVWTQELCKQFKLKYKKWLKILDYCVVFIIVLSICTILITNFMVIKSKPKEEIKFYEANKELAKTVGYETDKIVQKQYDIWFIITLYWIIYIGVYIWNRITITYKWQLWLLTILLIYGGVMVGRDFLNDFGLWLGYIL